MSHFAVAHIIIGRKSDSSPMRLYGGMGTTGEKAIQRRCIRMFNCVSVLAVIQADTIHYNYNNRFFNVHVHITFPPLLRVLSLFVLFIPALSGIFPMLIIIQFCAAKIYSSAKCLQRFSLPEYEFYEAVQNAILRCFATRNCLYRYFASSQPVHAPQKASFCTCGAKCNFALLRNSKLLIPILRIVPTGACAAKSHFAPAVKMPFCVATQNCYYSN